MVYRRERQRAVGFGQMESTIIYVGAWEYEDGPQRTPHLDLEEGTMASLRLLTQKWPLLERTTPNKIYEKKGTSGPHNVTTRS
jgi:hypothetical protein